MEACKVENNTGRGHFWMYVFRLEEGEYPNTKESYLPRPCMHCDNPPCVKVCPTRARFKREDGLVLTDYEVCAGYRYCALVCPYGVNFFHWEEPESIQYYDWQTEGSEVLNAVGGVIPPYRNPDFDQKYGSPARKVAGGVERKWIVQKCTFCVHRLEKGLEPACVANCPVEALHFGDLEDPYSTVSQLLRDYPSFRLNEKLGTQPRVYYIGGNHPTPSVREIEPVKANFVKSWSQGTVERIQQRSWSR